MKLFNYLCGIAAANPMLKDLLDSDNDSSSDDKLLLNMMGLLGGNQNQNMEKALKVDGLAR